MTGAVRSFGYRRVGSVEEALERKSDLRREGLILAGGTDLLVKLRLQSATLPPVEVIDVGRLGDLKGVSLETGGEAGDGKAEGFHGTGANGEVASDGTVVRVGALVTHAQAERDPELLRRGRLLCESCAQIGSPQIRNRGTIGGNFCNASPCADTLPALAALNARLVLLSRRGRREIALEEALIGPYETAVADDEILSEIRFPATPRGAGSSFIKLGRRNALSISRMSVAAVIARSDDGRMRTVRLAAGSVAPTARRFREIEEMLEGRVPEHDLFTAAGREMAAAMVKQVGRRWSTPYKEPVVAALVKRALGKAAAEAR